MEGNKVIVHNHEHSTAITGKTLSSMDESISVKFDTPLTQPFLFDEEVEVYIYDRVKGEMIFQGKVYSSLKDRMVITDLEHISTNQRRNEIRVSLEEPVFVKKIQQSFNQPMELPKTIPFEVVNMSAGGTLLRSTLQVPMHYFYFIPIPLPEEVLEVKVKIIRITKDNDNFLYGCKFELLSHEEEMKIRQFVFRRQMEERRKSL